MYYFEADIFSSVAQAGFQPMILRSQTSEFWSYRYLLGYVTVPQDPP